MKKTLFTTVLACVLTVSGFVAAAEDLAVSFNNDTKLFSSNVTKNLTLLVATKSDVDLGANLAAVSTDEKTLGYKRNGGNFVSLAQAVSDAQVARVGNANVTTITLGQFNANDTIEFGYQDADGGFHGYTPGKIGSDPGYYGGYNVESFYQLDFSEDPFDGMIEIVVGQPLPAPAVTLIVALAAGALFLLYKNRKERFIQTEQA